MSDEWYTPKWIFDGLDLTFDLDVSSDVDGISMCPAKHKYTIKDNGLQQNWIGTVWMNPPYSKPTPWIEKFIEHADGIALVPFSKSKWFIKLWDSDAKLLPLPVNLKFMRPDGTHHQIFMQTLLAGIGENACAALRKLQTQTAQMPRCR